MAADRSAIGNEVPSASGNDVNSALDESGICFALSGLFYLSVLAAYTEHLLY